ncbi:hypothetical protein H6P81_010928 [Aristolochia fimbriata]|uniref:Uncharacterized protein n=1 Tax=Aristolochia fimbriata TaxID=158543 RepID=A0AAV7EUK2_ARIFI|nr:hypothetical protein H6P81_010928 [Aristolochia fimbriata]
MGFRQKGRYRLPQIRVDKGSWGRSQRMANLPVTSSEKLEASLQKAYPGTGSPISGDALFY